MFGSQILLTNSGEIQKVKKKKWSICEDNDVLAAGEAACGWRNGCTLSPCWSCSSWPPWHGWYPWSPMHCWAPLSSPLSLIWSPWSGRLSTSPTTPSLLWQLVKATTSLASCFFRSWEVQTQAAPHSSLQPVVPVLIYSCYSILLVSRWNLHHPRKAKLTLCIPVSALSLTTICLKYKLGCYSIYFRWT